MRQIIALLWIFAICCVAEEEVRPLRRYSNYLKFAGSVAERLHSLMPAWVGRSSSPLDVYDSTMGSSANAGARAVFLTRTIGQQAHHQEAVPHRPSNVATVGDFIDHVVSGFQSFNLSAKPQEERRAADRITTGSIHGFHSLNQETVSHDSSELRQLRRWRSAHKTHPHHQPRIAKDHLPTYLQQDRHSQHHSFNVAQVSGTERSDPDATRPPFCSGGVVAVNIQTASFNCSIPFSSFPSGTSGVNDTGSSTTQLTGLAYAALNGTWRSNCTSLSSAKQCICSRDFILASTVLGDTLCLPREALCSTKLVEPLTTCEKIPLENPTRIPTCLRVPRKSTLFLALNFSCVYAYANPVDYQFFGIALKRIPNETFVVVNSTTAGTAAQNYPLSSIAIAGNYTIISNLAFAYAEPPETSIMPLTRTHPLYASGQYFYRAYNFNELSDTTVSGSIAVKTSSSGGELNDRQSVRFTLPLSVVPDRFLNGGRLYLEAGLRSSSIRSLNRVSDGVSVDRLTVDFADVVTPPIRTKINSDAIAIGVGVSVGVLVLIALVIFGVWKQRRNRRRKEKVKDE